MQQRKIQRLKEYWQNLKLANSDFFSHYHDNSWWPRSHFLQFLWLYQPTIWDPVTFYNSCWYPPTTWDTATFYNFCARTHLLFETKRHFTISVLVPTYYLRPSYYVQYLSLGPDKILYEATNLGAAFNGHYVSVLHGGNGKRLGYTVSAIRAQCYLVRRDFET